MKSEIYLYVWYKAQHTSYIYMLVFCNEYTPTFVSTSHPRVVYTILTAKNQAFERWYSRGRRPRRRPSSRQQVARAYPVVPGRSAGLVG